MADWIKMRNNLWDDPRVSAICDATDAGEAAVVGALYWLWASADQHSTDGFMPGLTVRQIDRKTGVPGFGDAISHVGWIEVVDGGIRIVRFDDHNGASAKTRALTARRVAKHKAVTQKTELGNADTVTQSLAARDLEREREREEDLSPSLRSGEARKRATQPKAVSSIKGVAVPACPDDVDSPLWEDWLALRKAKSAPVTDTVLQGARAEAEKAGLPLTRFLKIWCTRGSQGLQADWLKPNELAQARAGPPPAPMGKQAQGLMALEAMKSGNRMAAGRTADGAAEVVLLGAGAHAGR